MRMAGWCVTENLVADCYTRHVKDSAAKKPRELKQTTLHECPHVTRLAHALVSDEIEDVHHVRRSMMSLPLRDASPRLRP